MVSASEALIAGPKLEILRREKYGRSADRAARLIDQLELQLEELETAAAEDAIRAGQAADKTTKVRGFDRRKPVKKPFPEHLPRERVVVEAPAACTCCGSDRIVKMGEDSEPLMRHWFEQLPAVAPSVRAPLATASETLEVGPRQWKGIQTVREKFTCRDCESEGRPAIGSRACPNQPAPGAGPPDPAGMGRPQPSGVRHWSRTHGDTMAHRLRAVRPAPAVEPPGRPLCPRGRGSRPLHARRPGRRGERPTGHLTGWQGIFQADAYAGYNQLYGPERLPGPVASALCWSHARRKFFELANVESNIRKGKNAKEISPIAFDAVRRIDALFDIERDLDGFTPADRLEARQRLSVPLVADLERWLRGDRASLSKHAKVAKAIDYLLSPNHWPGFTRFLEDGRVCLTTNAAERSLRGVALGRTSWLFAGSERGGKRAAFMYPLIGTAKLNDIDPQAWLADVIARISDMPVSRLHELLPWEWNATPQAKAA